MLKAGANEGASGENAIIYSADKVDIIMGSIAIMVANSFLGELTPRMAEAVGSSSAAKILLPINRNGIEVAGVVDVPLPIQVDQLVDLVRPKYENIKG